MKTPGHPSTPPEPEPEPEIAADAASGDLAINTTEPVADTTGPHQTPETTGPHQGNGV